MPIRLTTVFLSASLISILALPGCVAPTHKPTGAASTFNAALKPEYIVARPERQHLAVAPKTPAQSGGAQDRPDKTGLTPEQKLSLFKKFADRQKLASENE